jgi:hypothetical protein
MRTSAAVAVIVGGTLCILGCLRSLPFNHYVLRAPQLSSGDLGEVRVGGRSETTADGLRIRVSALALSESTLVILNLDPDTLGYAFDPMSAVLKTGPKGDLAPDAYVGPGELNWVRGTYRECVARDAGTGGLPRRSDHSWHPLPPADTCFVLEYPVTVGAPETPELSLNGLAKGQARLSSPRFRVGGPLWSNVLDVKLVDGQ